MTRKLKGSSLFSSLVAGAVAAIGMVSAASAAVIFDNFKGVGATAYTEETRSADLTFGTVVNSLANVTVNQIDLRWRPNNDMDVTLFIYDSQLAGTFGSLNWTPIGNNLLFSVTKSVTAPGGAVDYDLIFDNISFTFQANHRYDIGILGSTGTLTGSWDIRNGCGNINTAMGGFESINQNANLAPGRSNVGYACVDPHIRMSAGVPEPGTLALLGLGLAGLAASRRRKE